MKSISDRNYSIWFITPALVLYAVFFVIPNLLGLLVGFTDWNVFHFTRFRFVGFENFKGMFKADVFYHAFLNTMYFTVVTVVVKNFLGILLAVILNRRFKLTSIFRSVIFAPSVFSLMVIAITFKSIYSFETGLLNTFLRTIGLGFLAADWIGNPKLAMTAVCLMDIWMYSGSAMVICLAGLQTIPEEYYEAARIDGASAGQQLWHITIPLIFQAITFNTILAFIGGLKVFGQVWALTNGGPADATQVLWTFQYAAFTNGLFGYAAAIGLVFTLFICVISFVLLGVMRKREVEY